MDLRIKLIMNPSAGRQLIRQTTNDVLRHLLDAGILLRADQFFTQKAGDAVRFAADTSPEDYDLIIAAGGDGTVNEVVNGMMQSHSPLPFCILPSGTVNDFAGYLNLPSDPFSFALMIKEFHTRKVDIGRAGNRYFLNVAAGGLLTDIAYKVPSDTKTALGRFAYLLEGAKDLPANMYKSLPIRMETGSTVQYDEHAFLFFAANTTSVGGFRRITPQANPFDGKLDVLVISKLDFGNAFSLIGQLLTGDHIRNDKVTYFQTEHLQVTTDPSTIIRTDLDGEEGDVLPIDIQCIPGALTLLVPKELISQVIETEK